MAGFSMSNWRQTGQARRLSDSHSTFFLIGCHSAAGALAPKGHDGRGLPLALLRVPSLNLLHFLCKTLRNLKKRGSPLVLRACQIRICHLFRPNRRFRCRFKCFPRCLGSSGSLPTPRYGRSSLSDAVPCGATAAFGRQIFVASRVLAQSEHMKVKE